MAREEHAVDDADAAVACCTLHAGDAIVALQAAAACHTCLTCCATCLIACVGMIVLSLQGSWSTDHWCTSAACIMYRNALAVAESLVRLPWRLPVPDTRAAPAVLLTPSLTPELRFTCACTALSSTLIPKVVQDLDPFRNRTGTITVNSPAAG